MMRKGLMATMVAMMLILGVAAAAFAQGAGLNAGTPGAGLCPNGSDLDGDGVCDNWVDADGDGVNDAAPRDGTGNRYGKRSGQQQSAPAGQVNQEQGAGRGMAFVDQNGDGVCDAYVDADGDGVNDAAPHNGTGRQQGRRSR